jgi:hypothetical protein
MTFYKLKYLNELIEIYKLKIKYLIKLNYSKLFLCIVFHI